MPFAARSPLVVKRRVWIGVGATLAASAAWWGWSRIHPPARVTPAAPAAPFVRFAGSAAVERDAVMRERAEYFDSTPLFFPTRWNFGQGQLPESVRRKPDQVFGSFEAKLTYDEHNMKSFSGDLVDLPEKISDVVARGNERPFAGFGQVDAAYPPLPERAGVVEVRRLSNGDLALAQNLKEFPISRTDFVPLEFLAVVGADGLVGQPELIAGASGEQVDAEEIENSVREFLVKTFRLGERLSPGRYRVLIGP